MPVLNPIGINDQYNTAPSYGAPLGSYVGGPSSLSAAHFGPSSSSSLHATGNTYPSTAKFQQRWLLFLPFPARGCSHSPLLSRFFLSLVFGQHLFTCLFLHTIFLLSPMHSESMSSGSSFAAIRLPHHCHGADGSEHHYASSTPYPMCGVEQIRLTTSFKL